MYKTDCFQNNWLFEHYGIEYHFYDGAYTKLHKHPHYWECFLVTSGKLIHNFRREKETLDKNTLCLMRPEDEHCFSAEGSVNAKHISISIDDKLLKSLLTPIDADLYKKLLAYDGLLSVSMTDVQVNDLFASMQKLLTEPYSEYDFIAVILKVKFIDLVELIYGAKLKNTNIYPGIIRDAIALMTDEEYIYESLDVICDHLPYSYAQLLNAFKKYTGKTMIRYFTDLKLEKAYNLLVSTNYKILHICSSVGFDSISYFNKQFKLKYGVTPSSLRSPRS